MATEPTTTHTTEAPGEHKAGFPPFQAETYASQLVWFVLTFAILYVVLAKIALPRVGGIIETRRNRIDGDLAAAQASRTQSEAAMAAYEKALAEARAKAQAIAADTRQKQAEAAEVLRKSTEAKLDAHLAEAEKSIRATKTAAMANVRGIATETAGAIVERLIGTQPAPQEVAAAVDDVIKR
jgi:F-type H+-transporting ATPase subunit b